LESTIFIFFRRKETDWRVIGIRVSYQIKRKSEIKAGGRQKKEENSTFFSYTQNYVLICSIH
jgi:hypothetical protein